MPGLGPSSLLTHVSGLDRTIRHVYTTDLPDPSRYLTPGDLVPDRPDLVPFPGRPLSRIGKLLQPTHLFAAAIRGAQPVLESDRSRIRLTAGISAPAEGVTALSGAWHEAGSARRLAALRSDTPISVVTSDEVASHELPLATVPASVLRSFRERLLGPLVAYDNRHRAELLPTLREFLACSGSWNACAAKMYVHVNTVRYRIRRIEDLTGRDLSSLDDQVDFFLALRIR